METSERITLLKSVEEEVFMKGSFENIGKANPGDQLFLWILDHSGKNYYYLFAKKYVFLGRTGDKTFEIEYTFSKSSAAIPPFSKKENSNDVKKMNMFFEEGGFFELKDLFFVPKDYGTRCTTDDKLFLKMISLKGNELQYQIILPDCLKSGVHKNEKS